MSCLGWIEQRVLDIHWNKQFATKAGHYYAYILVFIIDLYSNQQAM